LAQLPHAAMLHHSLPRLLIRFEDQRYPWQARDYGGAGRIGSDPHEGIEILRIGKAIGNAAAQRSAMNQNARGPNAP
jgi:hypothetical protein